MLSATRGTSPPNDLLWSLLRDARRSKKQLGDLQCASKVNTGMVAYEPLQKSQKGRTDEFIKMHTKNNCLNLIKERDPRVSLKMDGLDEGSTRRTLRVPWSLIHPHRTIAILFLDHPLGRTIDFVLS